MIKPVYSATVRKGNYKSRTRSASVRITITDAAYEAGLSDQQLVRFQPASVPETGALVAVAVESGDKGGHGPYTRTVVCRNPPSRSLRVAIPADLLRMIPGIPDEIDWDDAPELRVWAGDRLIAFDCAGVYVADESAVV